MRKPKRIKLRFLKSVAARFCQVRNELELARVLNIELHKLKLLAFQPQYNIFSVPKKDGSKRWIEDPEDKLQAVQDRLTFPLNALYYLKKPKAAYGFILSRRGEQDPRNIVTNARRHLGCNWLFNADLRDFFHQVKAERVHRMFSSTPFKLEENAVDLLVRLTTNQGRLPMGAPTSPVLSNFATLNMDYELQQLSDWASWTYTRYADDLSFSGSKEFTDSDISKIKTIVQDEGFDFNPDKFRLRSSSDVKEVTGIILGSSDIEIPSDFLLELHKDLDRLKNVIEVSNRMGKREKWIDKFQQQVEGKAQFVDFVLGEDDEITQEIDSKLIDALDPPDAFGSMSWVDFGYF